MTKRLFLVSLVDKSGSMMAGAHVLASDAARARAIGQTYLCTIPSVEDVGEKMHNSIKAKVSGWYAVKAVPSKAALSNAINPE